jgi:hypothetical protein
LRILGDIFRKEFQGDEAVQLYVLGFVHNAHSATAQLLDDAKVGNRASGEWRKIGHWRQCYAAYSNKSTRQECRAADIKLEHIGSIQHLRLNFQGV